jgi:hypothetical protein
VYIPKTSHYVCFLFLRNVHSRNTVGQDQEFWTTDVGKQHLEEKYIKFNYTFLYGWFFFFFVINNMCGRTTHMGMFDRGLLYLILTIQTCVYHNRLKTRFTKNEWCLKSVSHLVKPSVKGTWFFKQIIIFKMVKMQFKFVWTFRCTKFSLLNQC